VVSQDALALAGFSNELPEFVRNPGQSSFNNPVAVSATALHMAGVTLHRNSAAIPASRSLPIHNSLRPSRYSILSTALVARVERQMLENLPLLQRLHDVATNATHEHRIDNFRGQVGGH